MYPKELEVMFVDGDSIVTNSIEVIDEEDERESLIQIAVDRAEVDRVLRELLGGA